METIETTSSSKTRVTVHVATFDGTRTAAEEARKRLRADGWGIVEVLTVRQDREGRSSYDVTCAVAW